MNCYPNTEEQNEELNALVDRPERIGQSLVVGGIALVGIVVIVAFALGRILA